MRRSPLVSEKAEASSATQEKSPKAAKIPCVFNPLCEAFDGPMVLKRNPRFIAGLRGKTRQKKPRAREKYRAREAGPAEEARNFQSPGAFLLIVFSAPPQRAMVAGFVVFVFGVRC